MVWVSFTKWQVAITHVSTADANTVHKCQYWLQANEQIALATNESQPLLKTTGCKKGLILFMWNSDYKHPSGCSPTWLNNMHEMMGSGLPFMAAG